MNTGLKLFIFFVFLTIIIMSKHKITNYNDYNIYNPPQIIRVYKPQRRKVSEKKNEPKNKTNTNNTNNTTNNYINIELDYTYDFEPIEVQVINRMNFNRLQDTQSVHDTQIQRKLRKDYQDIPYATKEKENIYEEIIQNAPLHTKMNVEKVLKHVKNSNTNMSGYDENINTIVENIYKNLKTDDEKDYFYSSFENCIENGNVVCPTGIVTQLMLVNYLDKMQEYPKTQKQVFEEMLYTASKLRNETDEDEEFKQKFKQTIQQNYKNILTDEEMDKNVNEICDNL